MAEGLNLDLNKDEILNKIIVDVAYNSNHQYKLVKFCNPVIYKFCNPVIYGNILKSYLTENLKF